jgi:Pvc16 N-terminal domain
MSNALAISAVSAVLQYWLGQVFGGAPALSGVKVTARAPDILQTEITAGTVPQMCVNVFLHQVTHNAAFRNVELPSLAADGSTRLSSPPLALDLHYLMTAYGTDDWEAEALLGYAVLMLHDYPVFARADITTALQNLSSTNSTNSLSTVLKTTGLAEQIEMLKVTPETLGREEIAWIWSALKADYRPSYPFMVSLVTIKSPAMTLSSLPVLHRDIGARTALATGLPTLTAVTPPNGQPAAQLGDTVTVSGTAMSGTATVLLTNARLGISQTLPATVGSSGASLQFTVPNPALPPPQPDPTDLPAGTYFLSVTFSVTASQTMVSNSLPMTISATIDAGWAPVTVAHGSNVAVSVPCVPYLRPGQEVSLLIGGQQAPADPFTTPTRLPSFTFADLQSTSGSAVPARLRVDGIDSPILNLTSTPVTFTGPTVTVT